MYIIFIVFPARKVLSGAIMMVVNRSSLHSIVQRDSLAMPVAVIQSRIRVYLLLQDSWQGGSYFLQNAV